MLKMFNLNLRYQKIINIMASISVFIVNTGINFFLSPFIVENLGVSANGFIQLANNFVSYASLITIAMTSMSARFITIEIHRGNLNKAKTYYSSVFIGNLLILSLIVVPILIFIKYIDQFIIIPDELISSVKILFSLVFINFFINISTPDWAAAPFATNRIYISSAGQMFSNIIRAIVIILLYSFFPSQVWYVGVAAIISTIIFKLVLFNSKKILFSEFRVDKRYIDFKAIKELVSSGIWNTITQLGQILNQGLDLLIANISLGSVEMGVLSIVKIFPNLISTFAGTLTSVFAPQLTILYAKNNVDGLIKEIYNASKITITILTVPYCAFISFGVPFFNLWMPSQDALELQILSIITSVGFVFTFGTQVLYQIFSAINKLKMNSIVFLITSAISMIFTLIIVKNTSYGLIAICGISSVFNIIKNLFFVIPYSAKYLGLPKKTFFPLVWYSIRSVILLILIGFVFNKYIIINSWNSLLLVCIVYGIIGVFINFYSILSPKERQYLLDKLRIRN